jgi:hypothetical protein
LKDRLFDFRISVGKTVNRRALPENFYAGRTTPT